MLRFSYVQTLLEAARTVGTDPKLASVGPSRIERVRCTRGAHKSRLPSLQPEQKHAVTMVVATDRGGISGRCFNAPFEVHLNAQRWCSNTRRKRTPYSISPFDALYGIRRLALLGGNKWGTTSPEYQRKPCYGTEEEAKRTNKIQDFDLSWAQEVPGSNPGAPTIFQSLREPLSSLTLLSPPGGWAGVHCYVQELRKATTVSSAIFVASYPAVSVIGWCT